MVNHYVVFQSGLPAGYCEKPADLNKN